MDSVLLRSATAAIVPPAGLCLPAVAGHRLPHRSLWELILSVSHVRACDSSGKKGPETDLLRYER
jgi:hypothetical protein